MKTFSRAVAVVCVVFAVAAAPDAAPISNLPLLDRQQVFGYTQEDLKLLMAPMAAQGTPVTPPARPSMQRHS